MITKFATVISITAFAFLGAVAQAKVYDASESPIGVTDQMLLQSIDQTPALFGCDLGSFDRPTGSSADRAHQEKVPDIFVGNYDILSSNSEADACPVPMPSSDPFGNLAAR